jgi:Domain of unknown function (DUF2804), C-terminal
MFRGTRPLKRWRYVGVFCEELMACVAIVWVGPLLQSFWAVLPRSDGRLRERTRLRPRRSVVLGPGQLRISDGGVLLDLSLDENEGIQAVCPHGREHVWTRKQAGVPARGTLALDGGAPRQIEALAVIDDTAGYHARFTEWWWSAGVGAASDGTSLAWNLVAGVNDPPTGSERAVWVAGEPSEVGPVRFAPDLRSILATDGSELCFAPEAERRRRENLLIVRSDYRAPFGVFSGTLPGHVELARGLGVVEHHRAHW